MHLADLYPHLYHVADAENRRGIQAHGLLSATALLDLLEYPIDGRDAIERRRRPRDITIEHPLHGRAVVRDQRPLSEKRLAVALEGITVADWLALLNRHVFFWPTPERVHRMLSARPYTSRPHTLLIVDTRALVRQHGERMFLSRINSGATVWVSQKRGRHTFVRLADAPLAEWRRHRGRTKAVAEVLVQHAVPDILDLVIATEEIVPGADLAASLAPLPSPAETQP